MRRAPKYCATQDCLELIPGGTSYCRQHRINWAGGAPTRRRPPGWQRTRARILRRDKHTCYICGCPDATQVDHIDNLGSEQDDNLAAVCVDCHRRKTLAEARESRLT